jgi:CRISPR-associated protein Cas5h
LALIMYDAIRFELGGENAFFKKPDVNVIVYFTYNNIHKIALLGLLGAIIGLKGWRNYHLFGEEAAEYPEFYRELKNISVSILPIAPKGYFPKKIQYFNNSVGYASKEQGGNLQVYEQWLEKPKWVIYLRNDGIKPMLWEQLTNSLLEGRCIYIPYLGKNDFHAHITNVEKVVLELKKSDFIDSLFIGELNSVKDDETKDNRSPYIFTEYLPTGLRPVENFYTYSRVIYTNCKVIEGPETFIHGQICLSFM